MKEGESRLMATAPCDLQAKSICQRKLLLALVPGIIMLLSGIIMLALGFCNGHYRSVRYWPACLFSIGPISLGLAWLLGVFTYLARSMAARSICMISINIILSASTILVIQMRANEYAEYAIFEKTASLLSIGMSKDQVIGLFGKPKEPLSSDHWRYSLPCFFPPIIDIYFDANGKVVDSSADF